MSKSVKPLPCGKFPIYQKRFSEEVLYDNPFPHFTDLRRQRRFSEILTSNRLEVQEQNTTLLTIPFSLKNVI